MGIEPLLLALIVAAMFVVQAVRALAERFQDRIEFAQATLLGVRALAARHRMLPDRAGGGWVDGREGLDVHVWFDAYPARHIRRVLHQETGVRARRFRRHLHWMAPSILVVVRMPRSLGLDLRMSALDHVVPRRRRVPLQSPVLDQLLRVQADDPDRARRLLTPPEVHEPLMDLLGNHPLSVVTEDAIALWCARAVDDPEPLVDLAVEVAIALRDRADALSAPPSAATR